MSHIHLIRITAELARLLDADVPTFEAHAGKVGPRVGLVADVLRQTLAMKDLAPEDTPWGGYLAVDDSTDEVVGTCAFKGAPDRLGLRLVGGRPLLVGRVAVSPADPRSG